jgi:hypothetical protein
MIKVVKHHFLTFGDVAAGVHLIVRLIADSSTGGTITDRAIDQIYVIVQPRLPSGVRLSAIIYMLPNDDFLDNRNMRSSVNIVPTGRISSLFTSRAISMWCGCG